MAITTVEEKSTLKLEMDFIDGMNKRFRLSLDNPKEGRFGYYPGRRSNG